MFKKKKKAISQKLPSLLDSKGLSSYIQIFDDQKIDYDTFFLLSEEMLKELKIPEDKIPQFMELISQKPQ